MGKIFYKIISQLCDPAIVAHVKLKTFNTNDSYEAPKGFPWAQY